RLVLGPLALGLLLELLIQPLHVARRALHRLLPRHAIEVGLVAHLAHPAEQLAPRRERRNFRFAGAGESEVPSLAAWRELLRRMSQMCYETDLDRVTREQSVESSSRDMQRLYQELKQKTESERAEHEA